jgi:hypothetical protein
MMVAGLEGFLGSESVDRRSSWLWLRSCLVVVEMVSVGGLDLFSILLFFFVDRVVVRPARMHDVLHTGT